MITLVQLQNIMPLAKDRARLFLEPLNAAMAEFGIDTPLRQAAFLAQVSHESGQLRYTAEIANGAAYATRSDLGNTFPVAQAIAMRKGTDTGQFYKGRGLIQVTGYNNYAECTMALGINCVESPQLLEAPEAAARSAAWFWKSRNLNALADIGDFRAITKKINGGYNGWDDRLAAYNRAKKALGVGA
jgi:putative chitinase